VKGEEGGGREEWGEGGSESKHMQGSRNFFPSRAQEVMCGSPLDDCCWWWHGARQRCALGDREWPFVVALQDSGGEACWLGSRATALATFFWGGSRSRSGRGSLTWLRLWGLRPLLGD
jgi:hypothetical protein